MSFTFVLLGDLHVSCGDPAFRDDGGDDVLWPEEGAIRERASCTPEDLRELFAEVVARAPEAAFVVSIGDVTNVGSDEEFAAYLAAVDACSLPVHTIPGNHDHSSIDPSDLPAIASGEVKTPYERHVGRRWGSFDHEGVHFVWIDWTTWHLGFDREPQERWLHEHLSDVGEDVPVVMLTHDQMNAAFFEALPHPVVASFSGHWHTTRVVDVGGVRHTNTGPSVFGGLDYCPAHWRICTWTGSAIEQEVVVRGPLPSGPGVRTPENRRVTPWAPTAGMRASTASATEDVAWVAELSGAGFRGSPVVADGLVIAPTRDEVEPGGWLEAVDADNGERVWSVELATALKTTPLVCGDAVVAVSVAGEVVCVEIATGAERWRTTIHDDPLWLWVHLDPATDGERVFVGDTGRFGALRVADGGVDWMRDDLGQRENICCHAHPAVVDDLVVGSFAAQVPDLWAVDRITGETVWPRDVEPASVYRLPDMAVHLPRSPVSGIATDGDDIYVVRIGRLLDRIRANTGEVAWSARTRGWFNPARPLITDDTVVISEGMGSLWCFERPDGSLRWTTQVMDEAPTRVGPYRSRGGALLATPTHSGDELLVPTGDSHIVRLDAADGAPAGEVEVGAPILASLAVDDHHAYALGVDGGLRAIPIR